MLRFPKSRRFRYAARIRSFDHVCSRRSAVTLSMNFARSVRGLRSEILTSCCVIVDAAETLGHARFPQRNSIPIEKHNALDRRAQERRWNRDKLQAEVRGDQQQY